MFNSYKTIKFIEVEFTGKWRLDWSVNGQARYKPRENARIKLLTAKGDKHEISPLSEDVVVITGDLIHIPVE